MFFTVLWLTWLYLSNRITNNRMCAACVQCDINTPAFVQCQLPHLFLKCVGHNFFVEFSPRWSGKLLTFVVFVGCSSFSFEVMVFIENNQRS